MKTLGRSLHKILKPLAQKSGFADGRIFSQWQQIVGKDVAQVARPQKLNNNTLTLSVPNGAVAMEVQHQSIQLIERINSHFGFQAVKKIRTLQTYMELEPAPQAETIKPDQGARIRAAAQVEDVKDDTLRDALSRLGSYVEMLHSSPNTSDKAKESTN